MAAGVRRASKRSKVDHDPAGTRGHRRGRGPWRDPLPLPHRLDRLPGAYRVLDSRFVMTRSTPGRSQLPTGRPVRKPDGAADATGPTFAWASRYFSEVTALQLQLRRPAVMRETSVALTTAPTAVCPMALSTLSAIGTWPLAPGAFRRSRPAGEGPEDELQRVVMGS
jgi:hypothetical protein